MALMPTVYTIILSVKRTSNMKPESTYSSATLILVVYYIDIYSFLLALRPKWLSGYFFIIFAMLTLGFSISDIHRWLSALFMRSNQSHLPLFHAY